MGRIRLTGATSGYTELRAANAAGNNTITLPTTSGGEVIVSDSSGNVNIDGGTLYVDATNNRVGIGTSTARAGLTVALGSASIPAAGASTGSAVFSNATDGGVYGVVVGANTSGLGYIQSQRTDGTATTYDLAIQPNGGRVGIGTTSAALKLHVEDSGSQVVRWTRTGVGAGSLDVDASGNAVVNAHTSSTGIAFHLQASEKARLDSSGRFLVGTSSSASAGNAQYSKVQIQASTAGSTEAGLISLQRGQAATSISSGSALGGVTFSDNAGNEYATIIARSDGASGSGDYPGRLEFSTTADGASSPTERMRIDNTGNVLFAKTSTDTTVAGSCLAQSDDIGFQASFTSFDNRTIIVNRQSNDGDLISFRQAGTEEGTISVSGTTVSYNGAHLSRWSQLPGGVERTEILRGSVLSNIDEMCEWGDEENEQLNRMKISDIEGDKNVSGVFQAWDDDDDTYTNDFYCAMTGDFIIRIGAGVTVERGDLLMSAGDGTAKPQDDDIIRSKTIAKVTSTNVSCTYPDGSYCVPCVLMAC